MSHYDKKEKRMLAIYLSIFILLAAGIALSGYISYHGFEQQFRAQTGRQLSSIAELKVKNLDSWRKERLADAEMLRQNITFAGLAQAYINNPQDTLAKTQIQTWLESYQIYGYDRVNLLDMQGKTILSVSAGVPPISSAVAQQIPEVVQSKQVVMVDFYYSDTDQRIDLAILIPILNSQSGDQVIGLVSIIINPKVYLYPYINEWPSDSTSSETLLIRREGNEAIFLNPVRFNPNSALTLRFPLTDTSLPAVKAVLGQTGVATGLDYRGTSVLADVRPVPNSPWFLVSKMDTAEVYAPLRDRLWQTLGLAGMAIFVAGLGLITVWRQQRLQFFRAQAEAVEALIVSETRYRRLFEAARDGILILNAETGVIVDVNPFLVEMLGFPSEELVGKELWELGFFKDVAANKNNFLELQRKEYIRYEDLPLETADGRKFYVEFVSNVYQVNHHKVIQCNIRDITERKLAADALQESEERFHRAILGAPFPIMIHAEDGEVVTINTPWVELTGYHQSDIPTIADWTQKAYGARMETVRADIDSLYALDKPKVEGEYTIMTRSGGTRIWDFSSAPIGKLPDGRRLVISMAMDVTERKQAADALAIQTRIAFIFASVSDDEMFNEVLKIVLDVMHSPFGVFGYLDKNGDWVVPTMTRQIWDQCNVAEKTIRFPRETWGDSSWPRAIREKRIVYSNEPSANIPEGHVSIQRHISLPIFFQGEVISLFQVANKETDYTEADIRTLTTIAESVSPLLHARLQREWAEAALRESEERLKLAQQSSNAGWWDWDMATGQLKWSRELFGLFGLDPENARATFEAWDQVMHPDDKTNAYELLDIAVKNGTYLDSEYRVIQPSGQIKWIRAMGHASYDTEHKPMRMAGICIDITARKQTEDALQKSEERYRLLFNSMTEGFALHELIFDESGEPFDYRFLDINHAFEQLTGLKREDIIGRSQREVLPAEDPFWFNTYCKVTLTGESIHLEHYSAPLQKYYGVYAYRPAPNQFAVIFTDITERKLAEAELERTKNILSEGQMIAHLGSWEYIADTQATIWSEEQLRIYGLNPAGPSPDYQTMLRNHIHPDDAARLDEAFRQCLQDRSVYEQEHRIVRPDGSVRVVQEMARPYFDEHGKLVMYIGTTLDITERKRAEQQLAHYTENLEGLVNERTLELRNAQEQLVRQERLATLGQLAGSIGHELRNPLGVISNAIYFLKMTQPDANKTVKEYLDIIENEARTSDKIITDLLDFTRIKSLDRQPVAISELIHQTLERYPAPPSVEVALEIAPDLPLVYVDPQHIRQVLGNLTVNACQAMENVGKITISAAAQSDMIHIAVQDTGEGIPSDNMKKLFEPLFTTKTKGIGLGLAVSRKLAEANAGRIEVRSEPGQGSTFTLVLPIFKELK